MSDLEPGVEAAADDQQPFLRVIRGDASPEEVAAIVAVLSAMQAAPAAAPARRSEWGHFRRSHRTSVRSGPGGWRASSLPG